MSNAVHFDVHHGQDTSTVTETGALPGKGSATFNSEGRKDKAVVYAAHLNAEHANGRVAQGTCGGGHHV